MGRFSAYVLACALVSLGGAPAAAQDGAAAASPHRAFDGFEPVTDAMLESPDPADWLMYSRTYDAQRFSPLDQIDTSNVAELAPAWSTPLPDGVIEIIPVVYRGVMYLTVPPGEEDASAVWALDATTGERLWEHRPEAPGATRIKTLAIYDDMIYYTAPAARGAPQPVVALDAVTGEVRWQTPVTPETHTSGALVVAGNVISGRTCNGVRENCYIAAHDAATGEEVWRFYTAPGAGEPGDTSWAGAPPSGRRASTWGLPGTYDPVRNLLFWGISNPMPNTRADRHGGDHAAIPPSAPADLYSNSTVALRSETGELVWYYQHLPGDDWDLDATHERTLVTSAVAPDPAHVKWINPRVEPGERRDMVVTITEGGGLFANDRGTGELLWATPFPFDAPEFGIADIEPETGAVRLNWDLVFKAPGERKTICYWNTRSYWPTAYHPGTNALYTSYIDACRELTSVEEFTMGRWRVVPRPGSDPDALTGLAKIDLETGEVLRFNVGRAPSNGAVLATAGGLVFHGDMDRRFRAFDAASGEQLWETILGSNVSVSTITYAVEGRQHVAVMTGENLKVTELMGLAPEVSTPRDHNALYVFALPE